MANPLQQPPIIYLMPLLFLAFAFIVALPPMTLHLLFNPQLYLVTTTPFTDRITTAKHKFFYYSWRFMSPLLDPGDEPIKAPLLRKAYGAVLEVGPGVGDNIKYYRRGKVQRLVLVEPNTNMHERLRAKANAAGFYEGDGSLLLLGCGGSAADEKALALAGVGEGSMDTVASIHVLCGIPGPASAAEMFRRILKPGGLLVFYEHVRSEDQRTASWQEWYTTTMWPQINDGCCMDRPTGDWIIRGEAGDWGVGKGATTTVDEVNGDAEEMLRKRWRKWEIKRPEAPLCTPLPHVEGWAVKA